MDNKREVILCDVIEELTRAEAKFAPYNSAHEGYSVILEELDELWEVVKLNPKKIGIANNLAYCLYTESAIEEKQKKIHRKKMKDEAIQVAVTAIRFVKDVCLKED